MRLYAANNRRFSLFSICRNYGDDQRAEKRSGDESENKCAGHAVTVQWQRVVMSVLAVPVMLQR